MMDTYPHTSVRARTPTHAHTHAHTHTHRKRRRRMMTTTKMVIKERPSMRVTMNPIKRLGDWRCPLG